jgi:hypothetical protein
VKSKKTAQRWGDWWTARRELRPFFLGELEQV